MSASDPPLNFIFIVGSGRCGSSLLQEILSRHKGVGFMSNLDDRFSRRADQGRLNSWLYQRVPPFATRKGRLRFAPSEGYRALAREVSPLVATPGRPLDEADATPWLAERLRAFFERRAIAQRSAVFLHKFTGWPRVGLIEAALDNVRFINVVRDGRGVANSLTQMPWWTGPHDSELLMQLPTEDVEAWRLSGKSFPLLAGLEWKAVVESHERARRRVPASRWLELRYEDIVDNHRPELAKVLEFCSLPWTTQFEGQLALHRFEVDRRDAFRRDLAGSDIEMLEQHLGHQLRRYGYLDTGIPTQTTIRQPSAGR
jgi:hypothetical protein